MLSGFKSSCSIGKPCAGKGAELGIVEDTEKKPQASRVEFRVGKAASDPRGRSRTRSSSSHRRKHSFANLLQRPRHSVPSIRLAPLRLQNFSSAGSSSSETKKDSLRSRNRDFSRSPSPYLTLRNHASERKYSARESISDVLPELEVSTTETKQTPNPTPARTPTPTPVPTPIPTPPPSPSLSPRLGPLGRANGEYFESDENDENKPDRLVNVIATPEISESTPTLGSSVALGRGMGECFEGSEISECGTVILMDTALTEECGSPLSPECTVIKMASPSVELARQSSTDTIDTLNSQTSNVSCRTPCHCRNREVKAEPFSPSPNPETPWRPIEARSGWRLPSMELYDEWYPATNKVSETKVITETENWQQEPKLQRLGSWILTDEEDEKSECFYTP